MRQVRPGLGDLRPVPVAPRHEGGAGQPYDQATGQSRGFGFVEMATTEEADNAVQALNGRDLDGRSLKVEISKPKTNGGGARSGGGGFGSRSGGNWR